MANFFYFAYKIIDSSGKLSLLLYISITLQVFVSRVLAASVGAVNGTHPRGASSLSGGYYIKVRGKRPM